MLFYIRRQYSIYDVFFSSSSSACILVCWHGMAFSELCMCVYVYLCDLTMKVFYFLLLLQRWNSSRCRYSVYIKVSKWVEMTIANIHRNKLSGSWDLLQFPDFYRQFSDITQIWITFVRATCILLKEHNDDSIRISLFCSVFYTFIWRFFSKKNSHFHGYKNGNRCNFIYTHNVLVPIMFSTLET